MNDFLFSFVDTYQNRMDASYQEKSMLTNLFVDDKFWGWMGLTTIVICLAVFFWSFYPDE